MDPKQAIKVAYSQIMRTRKGSLLGEHVKIEELFKELEKNSKFNKEETKRAILQMFYIDGTVDLAPGKGESIEDANGNKFSYLKFGNENKEIETFLYFVRKEGLAYAVTKGMDIENLPEDEIKKKCIELRDNLYELNDLVQEKHNIKNNLIQ